MTSTTRRISISSEQLQSDALRIQLFSACCAYGLVEWLRFDEDANYNTTTVRIQFQKLSSADRLRSDMQQRGQAWQIESEAAAPCVGSDVLLSSSEALPCSRVQALIPSLSCTELSAAGGSASAPDAAPTATMATFEEKSFLLHGRGTTSTTATTARAAASSSKVTAEQEAALWSGFEQQSSAVRHSCLGPYCAVLHLASAHDANEFLLRHQLALAERHGVYAIHVGSIATSALAAALPKMLARHALSACPVDGRVVRGYVVAMPSNTYCIVDAGLYPSLEQAAANTLVNTHTNFLSVSLGDEVQVQLSTSGGLSIAGEGMVGGKLLRVLVAAAFSTRRSAAKVQLPTTAARTLRTSNLARSVTSTAAPPGAPTTATAAAHQPGLKPPGPPHLASALKRSAASVRPMSGTAAKALASKLFRNIQEKKNGGVGGEGVSAERVCTYPAGLSVYTRLLVRVERIDDEGLHARCVAEAAENCGYAGPVFVPAALVPSDATTTTTSTAGGGAAPLGHALPSGVGGEGWRSYAVVGERMHVALLYMVAVGGSAATMRGVASKREADLRRAAVATAGEADTAALPEMGDDGEEGSTGVVVGTSVTAVVMLQLSEGDLGVPVSSAYSRTFPAYLLRAGGPHASAALRQTPLLLPAADLGPLDPSTLYTSPATLTISEVVNDVARGQYAVVVPYAVYAARQAERAAALESKKRAEVDEVKRRLAAVMGDDILDVLKDDDDDDGDNGTAAMKRPRTEH